jgi:hypothetical protein
LHGLTLAPTQKQIMDECIRRGQPPPESIQNAPELNAGLGLYYVAFLDLTGCRQLGEAMGPIDWLAVDRYCERYDIEGEAYEDMHFYIGKMDHAFMTHFREKSKATHDAAMRRVKQKAKAPPRRGKR